MWGRELSFFLRMKLSLGVTLDSRLTWEAYVTQIGKKINRVLYTLRFIRHCTSEALRTRLVQALIVPHLDYCSVVYLDANKQLKIRLQRLSNSGVRYIFGIRRDSSITPYRKGLGWLCVDSRRSYFMAILIYKILRLGQPAYLSQLFTNYVPKKNARGQLRHRELSLPNPKDCGSSSLQLLGTKLWNSLPPNIRYIPTLKSFKNNLSCHLLTLDP